MLPGPDTAHTGCTDLVVAAVVAVVVVVAAVVAAAVVAVVGTQSETADLALAGTTAGTVAGTAVAGTAAAAADIVAAGTAVAGTVAAAAAAAAAPQSVSAGPTAQPSVPSQRGLKKACTIHVTRMCCPHLCSVGRGYLTEPGLSRSSNLLEPVEATSIYDVYDKQSRHCIHAQTLNSITR